MRLLSTCLLNCRDFCSIKQIAIWIIAIAFAIANTLTAKATEAIPASSQTDTEQVVEKGPAVEQDPAIEQIESWLGVDATEHASYLSSGAVFAPFASIHDPGWRFRIFSGGGLYSYSGVRDWNGKSYDLTFNGRVIDLEFMLGYQLVTDWGIVKAYAGAHQANHKTLPKDDYSAVQGTRTGAKLALETWTDLPGEIWLSTDLNFSSAFGSYAATTRLGQRLDGDLSLGIELGAFGNDTYDAVRAGVLLRWRAEGWGEFQLGGGVSGDYAQPRTPYASASYLTRF